MSKLSLVAEQPEPDPLAALIAERAALSAESDRLSAIIGRLEAFDAEVAAATLEIEEIEQREMALFSAWADRGGVGDAPEPLTAERKAALANAAVAQSKAAAGNKAAAGVKIALDENQRKSIALAEAIDALVLDEMEAKFCAARENFRQALRTAQGLAAETIGYRRAILERAERFQGRGLIERAREVYRRVEVLDRDGIDFDASPTNGEVQAATDAARSFASQLLEGNQ